MLIFQSDNAYEMGLPEFFFKPNILDVDFVI